jgi:DNA (cytosine-5)-methyltransferase 1
LYFRGTGGREVFPIRGENAWAIDVVNKESGMPRETNRVYSSEGLSPTLNTMQGGGREPKIAIPVLTPDRAEKRQNGRRFKENGEPMFTLIAQDRHGVAVQNPLKGKTKNGWHFEQNIFDVEGLARTLKAGGGSGNIPKVVIKIKEATKQGYAIAEQGDSINFSLPNSKTRRGRVGKQVAQTLDTSCNQATITKDMRIRKLTPRECWRLQGFPDLAFDKAQEVNSNSQLYKQAGNSVTVNVIAEIAKRL